MKPLFLGSLIGLYLLSKKKGDSSLGAVESTGWIPVPAPSENFMRKIAQQKATISAKPKASPIAPQISVSNDSYDPIMSLSDDQYLKIRRQAFPEDYKKKSAEREKYATLFAPRAEKRNEQKAHAKTRSATGAITAREARDLFEFNFDQNMRANKVAKQIDKKIKEDFKNRQARARDRNEYLDEQSQFYSKIKPLSKGEALDLLTLNTQDVADYKRQQARKWNLVESKKYKNVPMSQESLLIPGVTDNWKLQFPTFIDFNKYKQSEIDKEGSIFSAFDRPKKYSADHSFDRDALKRERANIDRIMKQEQMDNERRRKMQQDQARSMLQRQQAPKNFQAQVQRGDGSKLVAVALPNKQNYKNKSGISS